MPDYTAVILNPPITNADFIIQTNAELLLKEHHNDRSVNYSNKNRFDIILPDELKVIKNDT